MIFGWSYQVDVPCVLKSLKECDGSYQVDVPSVLKSLKKLDDIRVIYELHDLDLLFEAFDILYLGGLF